MVKKKIIISGATSALMNAVIDLIQPLNNYHIVGITTNLQKVQRKDIDWVECDLAVDGNDYAFIKGANIIIHAAAISNAYTLQDYLNINLKSTKALVDQANYYQVNKIVYISSIFACETSGDYGLSKAYSEKYIISNTKSWLIIRPSVLYGYSERAPIDRLIKKIAVRQIIPCPVGDPFGLIPLYYLDAARLIFDAIFIDNLSNVKKVVLGPKAFNYKSLIFEISKRLERKILIIPFPKIIMMGIKNLIQILSIKTGIYPDQIVRLYNPNKNVKAIENNKLKHLSDYIRQQS